VQEAANRKAMRRARVVMAAPMSNAGTTFDASDFS
jgi:hypothetical protein